MAQIKVNEGVQIQRGPATYTGGEILDVPADEARKYVKDGLASNVAEEKKS